MTKKKKRSLSTKKRQGNKPFEFNQAAPNRYIAHFYRECTVDQFLKIILETKPEDYGCIVIFDPKDRPLGSYHYKNGEIIHDFTNEKVDDKIIRFAFGNGSGASMDYTLTVS